MKKIFFIMSTDDASGAEKVNFDIISGLKDKYEFYWVSRQGKINDYLKEKNIKWIKIDKLSVNEIRRITKLYNPDILHATDFKASVICSLSHVKVPIIEHLHNNSPWIKKVNINSLAFLYAGLKANKILTVSDSIEKEYIFSKYIKNKIRCISNPVSRKKIINSIKNVNDEIINYDICCVARITPPKNYKRFVDIVSEVKKTYPNIKCVWVGGGEQYEECVAYAKKLDLASNIDFVGFKANPYIYMSHSKIFMLTSDWEGYGLVAFEALTIGLPAVVSDVGGLPDIVDDECGKLCRNKVDFCNEIIKLLSDKKIYELKSNNAIEKSKKLDNYDKYIKLIDQIYQEVL